MCGPVFPNSLPCVRHKGDRSKGGPTEKGRLDSGGPAEDTADQCPHPFEGRGQSRALASHEPRLAGEAGQEPRAQASAERIRDDVVDVDDAVRARHDAEQPRPLGELDEARQRAPEPGPRPKAPRAPRTVPAAGRLPQRSQGHEEENVEPDRQAVEHGAQGLAVLELLDHGRQRPEGDVVVPVDDGRARPRGIAGQGQEREDQQPRHVQGPQQWQQPPTPPRPRGRGAPGPGAQGGVERPGGVDGSGRVDGSGGSSGSDRLSGLGEGRAGAPQPPRADDHHRHRAEEQAVLRPVDGCVHVSSSKPFPSETSRDEGAEAHGRWEHHADSTAAPARWRRPAAHGPAVGG